MRRARRPPTYPLSYGGGKRLRQPSAPRTVISNFDGGYGVAGSWVNGAGAGTKADETVLFRAGTQAIAITDNGSGSSIKEITPAITDYTNYDIIYLSVHIADVSALTSVVLYFLMDASFSKMYSVAPSAANLSDGWNVIALDKSQFSVTGAADWAAVNQLWVKTTGTTKVVFDELSCYVNDATTGTVIFTFDDGYDDLIELADGAVDTLASHNWGATLFPIGISIMNHTDFLKPSNLQTMKLKKWDFGSHTWNLHSDLRAQTQAVIEADLQKMHNWMVEQGLDPIDCFCYPLGFQDGAAQAGVGRYYSYARSVETYIIGRSETPHWQEPLKLRAYNVANTTTLAAVKAIIDLAAANNLVLILVFHNIVTTSAVGTEWNAADFAELCTYIATTRAADIQVKTMGQYINEHQGS